MIKVLRNYLKKKDMLVALGRNVLVDNHFDECCCEYSLLVRFETMPQCWCRWLIQCIGKKLLRHRWRHWSCTSTVDSINVLYEDKCSCFQFLQPPKAVHISLESLTANLIVVGSCMKIESLKSVLGAPHYRI